MNKDTCILYFTLTPEIEANTKQWSHSNRINLQIAQNLYDYSKAQIKKVELPFIEINEQQQVGDSFGEKIVHAIEQVFDKGYDDVIVVGNDCINFNHKDLSQAEQLIEQGHQTIGLTKDGGVYLFSIAQATHTIEQSETLKQLPWCTNELGQALQNYLHDLGSVEQLSIKIDIDNSTTLAHALGLSLATPLVALLQNLLFPKSNKNPKTFLRRISFYVLKGLFFRGPPTSVLKFRIF